MSWAFERWDEARELEKQNAELKQRAEAAEAKLAEARQALEPFALIGDPADYHKVPKRLDVPFEWCERAKQVLDGQG